jgi:hypothetical protein
MQKGKVCFSTYGISHQFLKKKGVTKDLKAIKPSSNIETMVDKEEVATTPSKKNAKPPKTTYNSLY